MFYLPIGRYGDLIGQHRLPMPALPAYLTYFTELVPALCLMLGIFARVAALMIGIEMLVMIFVFNWEFGYFWTNRGLEYVLLWLLLCIAIFFCGGGRYSLDHQQGIDPGHKAAPENERPQKGSLGGLFFATRASAIRWTALPSSSRWSSSWPMSFWRSTSWPPSS